MKDVIYYYFGVIYAEWLKEKEEECYNQKIIQVQEELFVYGYIRHNELYNNKEKQ